MHPRDANNGSVPIERPGEMPRVQALLEPSEFTRSAQFGAAARLGVAVKALTCGDGPVTLECRRKGQHTYGVHSR
jgi:hypothetical protein